MSTEKLSELSKPVDFLKSATLIAARNFERWSKLAAMTHESSSVLHSITLLETSQLLSALLARIEELEGKRARYESVRSKLMCTKGKWVLEEAPQGPVDAERVRHVHVQRLPRRATCLAEAEYAIASFATLIHLKEFASGHYYTKRHCN